MSNNNIMNCILIQDKLSFIEINIINQNQGSVLSTRLNKKKYFDMQNNMKKLTKHKPKKIISLVKQFNNYEERQIGNKYYYCEKEILKTLICNINRATICIKNCDNRILDPTEFPDFDKNHTCFKETSYRYRYMPDNRVINSIDVYFSSINESDNISFNIYLKFKVCDRNKKIIINNLNNLLKKLNWIPHYKQN
jgi:hypothetical protein